MGYDESYTLSVPTSGEILLRSKTVYGSYHGLEVEFILKIDIKPNDSLESI